MITLILAVMVALGQDARPASIDVSTLRIGAATPIAELDLGRIKGELRRLAWSPDATQLYVQTAEPQRSGPDRLYHSLVPAAGGAPMPAEGEPAWATTYWSFKSDRSAPGIPSLMIDVEQKQERVKVGTIPGLTFSWGPAGSGAIAFVDPTGRLMLLDREKHKRAVEGAKDVLLPAWSTDGTRLAYVKKTGRRTYMLVQSDIAR